MNGIEMILSRKSVGKLSDVGPQEHEIDLALNCAMSAPDHGRIMPWRYHLVMGEARRSLGELFLQAALEDAQGTGRDLTEKQREKFVSMPLRAPLLMVVGAKVKECKIPRVEQVLAVGAAVQNMQLAFHALGYGSIWRTGEMAAHARVKASFGLGDQDELVAFLYVGRPLHQEDPVKNSAASDFPDAWVWIDEINRTFVRVWNGESEA